jgi:hypothetical protein
MLRLVRVEHFGAASALLYRDDMRAEMAKAAIEQAHRSAL